MSKVKGLARFLLRAGTTSTCLQHAAPCPSALAAFANLTLPPSASWVAASSFQALRGISTSFGTFSNASLGNLLAEEIKYEKENYVKPEEVARGPPAPFTLSEAPGDTMLTLTRTYNNEQISVDLHVNNQPSIDEEEEAAARANDEAPLNTVVFNVHVSKGDNSLVFECECNGLFMAINHLSHETKDMTASDSIYTGPVFDELDDGLQEEFRSYLFERGITPEFGEYLRHLVFDKEVREYQSWLSKVADFVAKK